MKKQQAAKKGPQPSLVTALQQACRDLAQRQKAAQQPTERHILGLQRQALRKELLAARTADPTKQKQQGVVKRSNAKQQQPAPSAEKQSSSGKQPTFVAALQSAEQDLARRLRSTTQPNERRVLVLRQSALRRRLQAAAKSTPQSQQRPQQSQQRPQRSAAEKNTPCPFRAALQKARAQLAQRRKSIAEPLEKRVLAVQIQAIGQRLRKLRQSAGSPAKPS